MPHWERMGYDESWVPGEGKFKVIAKCFLRKLRDTYKGYVERETQILHVLPHKRNLDLKTKMMHVKQRDCLGVEISRKGKGESRGLWGGGECDPIHV
jgi:hypothetical protein